MSGGHSVEMGLLVSFPDQSETFVLGFEAGQIWAQLEAGRLDEVTMHTKNQEIVLRMAIHHGLAAGIVPTVDKEWSVAFFSRNPPRLLVVPK